MIQGRMRLDYIPIQYISVKEDPVGGLMITLASFQLILYLGRKRSLYARHRSACGFTIVANSSIVWTGFAFSACRLIRSV